MTRLFKMSLGLVALLLLTMLVLTGCGHAKLEEGINNAQSDADAAQSAADANLAQAKQAVIDATASLEAAIAAKADSTTLAAEVTKLNAAVEAAKAAATTADGALKIELEAAIAAAKATIMAEGENLVMALDAKLTELLNSKASSAALEAEIDRLNKVIEAMKAITDSAVDGDQYRNLATTIQAYIIVLDTKVDYYDNTGLYSASWGDVENAAELAYIRIMRAQNFDDIKYAMSEFEAIFLTDGIKSTVDSYYISVVAAENNKAITLAEIDALCDMLEADVDNKEFIKKYHDGSNLLLRAVKVYAKTLAPVVSELADRYILPDGVTLESGASGAQDIEDLAGAYEYLEALDNIFDIDELPALFQQTAVSNADMLDYVAISKFVEVDIENFVANTDRAVLLKKAVDDAAKASALDKGYNDIAEGAEATTKPLELKQEIVNDLDKWNDAIDLWNATYDNIPVNESATAETKARHAALVALISDTQAKMEADRDAFRAMTLEYKEDALTFQLIVSKFYNIPATDMTNLTAGYLDAACSKVTLASGTDIKNALDAYDALILAYPEGAGSLDDADNDETYLVYDKNQKKVFESYDELQRIAQAYYAQADIALTAWESATKVVTEGEGALTVDNITIYDTSVYAALEWFEGAYIPKDGGELVWDTVNGEAAYNLFKKNESDKNTVVKKSYYDALLQLKDKLDQLIETKAAEATAIKNKFAALQNADVFTAGGTNNVKLSQKAAVTEVKTLLDAYLNAELTQNKYVADNTTLNEERGFTISTELQEALAGYVERVATLQTKLDAIKTAADALDAKATEAYDAETKQFKTPELETEYVELKNALRDLIDAFLNNTSDDQNKGDDKFNGLVEGEDGDATLWAAKDSLLTAQENIARDEVYTKRAELLALKLGTIDEYFAATTDENGCTRTDYENALKALLLAINSNYEGVPAAALRGLTMTEVEATIAAAKRVLALDNVYEALDNLNAVKPTATEYKYFEGPEARAAYANLVTAIENAIAAGYEVEGYGDTAYCGGKLTIAETDADLVAIYDAIDAAEEIIARDLVGEKLAALTALSVNDDVYKYFVDDAAKETYKTAAEALKNAIDDYNALIAVSGVAKSADVTAAEEEHADALVRIAKYEAFEGYYKVIYNSAVTVIENAEASNEADILAEIDTLYKSSYFNNVDTWTVEEINNAQRKAEFLNQVNKILTKYGLANVEAPSAE